MFKRINYKNGGKSETTGLDDHQNITEHRK